MEKIEVKDAVDQLIESVKENAKKAGKGDKDEALKHTQAALNAANAVATLIHAEKDCKKE
jgi:hypothetical protein